MLWQRETAVHGLTTRAVCCGVLVAFCAARRQSAATPQHHTITMPHHHTTECSAAPQHGNIRNTAIPQQSSTECRGAAVRCCALHTTTPRETVARRLAVCCKLWRSGGVLCPSPSTAAPNAAALLRNTTEHHTAAERHISRRAVCARPVGSGGWMGTQGARTGCASWRRC